MSNFNDIKQMLIEELKKNAEDVLDDAKNRIVIPDSSNAKQFVDYANSLKVGEIKEEGNEISIEIGSDLRVGGDSKWKDVPVGMFLECGTGPLGKDSNRYDHGYPYTLHVWDWFTKLQNEKTPGQFGLTANPHLIPAFEKGKDVLLQRIHSRLRYKK